MTIEEPDLLPTTVELRATRSVRIHSAPSGEAPLSIREQWVGLVLPLIGADSARDVETFGVTSGPKGLLGAWWGRLLGRTKVLEGYTVDSRVALSQLECKSPEAVRWWKDHAPHFFTDGFVFVFDEASGDLVE